MPDKLTDIKGIGPKTEQKIRKAIGARNRNTGNAGDELTVREAVKNEAITKSKLAANQQVALSDEAFSFSPTRRAKNTVSRNNNRDRSESDTIRRGDFTVGKDELQSARDRFEDVPEDRREEDKNSRDPVVTDLDVWRNNISRFDFPGVDTPSNRRVRTDDTDIALNDTTGLSRPRETFRNSKPEPDEAQRQLGTTPKGADAERTGLVRAKDGEFVERPLRPTDGGAYRSANGQTVTGGLQDPTIGRDPDDGEFVDLPAGGEPAVPLPDAGGTDGPSDVVGAFVQGGDSRGLNQLDEQGLDAGVAVAGFASHQFDPTDDETPNAKGLGIQAQGPLSAAKVTDDDPDLGDETVGTLRETVDYLENEYEGNPNEELPGFDEFSSAVRQEAKSRGDR